jgi:peptide/nickel transport system substrate-binding protein
MPKKLKFSIFLLIAAFLLVACQSGQKAEIKPNVLTYAITSDITSLDPVRVTEDSPRLISTQVIETLVTFDENLKLTPLLAESWESKDAGREWIFKIRKGVYFHNDQCFKGRSRPVTAEDVAYSIKRMLNPKTKTYGAFILTDILKGAEEFLRGKTKDVEGIEVKDQYTIVFKLKKPYAQFPVRLSLPFAAVIPKEAVNYYGALFGQHPVGTGPFKFKAWDPAKGEILLELNKDYWRKKKTNLDEIHYLIMKSEATVLTSFLNGTIDAFEVSPAIARKVFMPDGSLREEFKGAGVIKMPVLTVHFVGFNFENPLLRDRNLRLACNYAIDKHALVELLNSMAVPANGPLVPPVMGSTNKELYPQNIEKAKALLKKTSYKGQELVYITDNSPTSVAIAEFLQESLKRLGIKIRIEKYPEAVWVDKLTKGEFDLGKLYYAFDYPSPDNGLAQFLSYNFAPSGPNFLHYVNKKFDKLYEKALTEMDSKKAEALYSQLNQIIREDAPWIFLYVPVRTILVQHNVKGLEINSLSFSLLLENIQKTK